ncbi:hypothetical protein D3C81_1827790 [compost metagenome]
MNAEQVGQFVQASQGNAAFEPVVDVLGRHTALGGEVGRSQATLVEEGLEAVTGGFHAAECSGAVPVGI